MKLHLLVAILCSMIPFSVRAESRVGELFAAPEGETVRMTKNSKFTIHETKTEYRNLRHFESADHHHCAVMWSGKSHPDLSTVMEDTDVAEYHKIANAQARPRRGQHLLITTSHVVVEMWGHMGAVQGKVYSLSCDVKPGDLDE